MSKTLMILFMFFCTLTVQAGQKKEKVIVTLNDGTTVVGYEVNDLGSGIKNFFRSTGSIPSFVKVSPQMDGKNAKTYKAKEIKGYIYANDTTRQYESQYFNAPIPFKTEAKIRGLFQVVKRLPNGTIYTYQTYSTQDSKDRYVSSLNATYGVKLRGDDRIYNIIVNGQDDLTYLLLSLSRKGPKQLAEKYKDYFNDKEHQKEILKDPTIIIRLYDEYLKSNPAISRPEKK